MKVLNFIKTLTALIVVTFVTNIVSAQLVNCNVFLKGQYVEVGINSNGAFGSGEAAPAGYHPRGGVSMKNSCTGSCSGTLGLGWVADPDKDGWTIGTPPYFGDYFLPGTPQEGWSLEVNGVQSNAWNQSAGCGSGVFYSGTLSGSNVSYYNSGGRSVGTWQGIDGNGISVRQVTTLDTNNLFFTISVTLTNTSGVTRNNVYYQRTVDPDQEVATTGVYTTINTITYQLPDTLNATLVSATGVTYTRAYLGLGTLDCRAKCYMINSGLAPTVNCDALYAGSGTVRYTGVDTLDAGIGIVFNLGNIAAGDSVKFAYAYILNTSDIINAFKSTLPNWTATGDTASAHIVGDTASVCVSTLTTVSITNPGTFTWAWTALTGETLTTYSGPSTQVNTGATVISLRAIGVDACTGLKDTLYLNLNPVKPLPSTPTAGSSSPVCEGSSLNLTSSCPTTGVTYSWSGPASYVSGLQNPTITNVPLAAAGVYTVYAVLGGCPSNAYATTSVTVNPQPSPITGVASVCIGSTTALSDITGGAAWSSTTTTVATVGTGTGVVSGVASGTSTISYTLFSTGCAATKVVTVNPLPLAITGIKTVCAGSATALSDATAGGTWSSSNTTVASIGSSTGLLTGLAIGTATISYKLATSCAATTTVTITPALFPITGPPSVCAGSSVTLSDASAGGTWSSSTTTVATIATSSGLTNGVLAGTSTITYATGAACYASRTFTVNPVPLVITGTTTVCAGLITTLSDAIAGGTWSSSNTVIATVGSSAGDVTGVSAGSATITYTTGLGCNTTKSVTVNNTPLAITPLGIVNVCLGTTSPLSDATPGGIWSSSATGVATVSAGGLVTGVVAGTATISYTLGGCSATTTASVIIGPAAILPASFTLCTGNNFTLIESTGGGTWSSSNTAVVIVSGGGTVTGITVGTATITYTTSVCFTIATVTVNLSANAGSISGASAVCVGSSAALTDAAAGGIWSSSSTAIATVGIGTGLVTGVSAGTVTISYTVTNGCGSVSATATTTVLTIPGAGIIVGAPLVCAGTFTTLSDAVPGGVWSSSNSHATISGTGVLTGVSPGTDTIIYTVTNICGTASTTKTITIGAFLTAGTITGASGVCAGASVTLTDPAVGGVWSSSNTNAAVGSVSGIVTGLSGGVSVISYTVSSGCGSAFATKTITINPLPNAGAIVGISSICVGSTAALSDAAPGGVWSTSNTNATITGTGLLTPLTPGTVTISYSLTNGCGTVSATKIITIGAFLTAGAISGLSNVCAGSAITLSDPVPGGIWSSSNAGATVLGGIVTGVSGGVDTISYTVTGSCGTVSASHTVTINPLPDAGSITGPSSICIGPTTTYTDIAPGGVWSISNANASITAGGVVTPLLIGTDTISYTVTNGCGIAITTQVITIGAFLTAGTISGPGSVCAGSAITLSDAVSGGVWSSSNTSAAVTGGVVTGAAEGTDTISYSVTSSCGTVVTSAIVTVNPLPDAGSITGPASLCIGSSATYADAAPGGVWSVSNADATITGGGFVTPFVIGTDTISYSVTNSCGTAVATSVLSIGALLTAGTISGPAGVCSGASISLSDWVAGGVWSSSNSNAAVGPASGIVTGTAAGIDTISYTVTSSCGSAVTTAVVTISSASGAGIISGPSAVCVSSLITLTDAVPGGAWSSSNVNATITIRGIVTGIFPGTDTINYTISNFCGIATTTKIITITTFPVIPAITGPGSVCAGGSITLFDALGGGVWSSGNTALAIVGAVSGLVTGVSSGADVINYSVTNACGTIGTSTTIMVNALPDAGTITGPDSICTSTTITLVDAVPGGVWSAGNANATVTGSGMVTGIFVGTDPISYSVTNGCGTVAAVKIIAIQLFPGAGLISGPSGVCAGSAIIMTDPVPGGTWLTSNGNAFFSGMGILNGVTPGIDSIFYAVTNACGTAVANKIITINPAPVVTPVSGATGECTGSGITLADGTPGGVWSSSNPAVATIGALSGFVLGLSSGTTVISYTVSNGFGCTASATYNDTVFAVPVLPAISGSIDVCNGSTVPLSNSVSGGVWTSGNTAIATVGAVSGIVTGVSLGIATISYTVTNICGTAAITRVETVNAMPTVAPIAGASNVCVGAGITLTDATAGGVWSSTNISVATVISGLVTGMSSGPDTIIYIITNACGSVSASMPVMVNPLPFAGTIIGMDSVCAGASFTLTDAAPGGLWSMGNANATVSSSGIVTGVTAGTDPVSYSVTNICGTAVTSMIVTINPLPNAGVISGASNVCVGAAITLTDAAVGGVWSSSNANAAVAGGIVTGIVAGSDTIMYSVTNSCGTVAAVKVIAINTMPDAGTITGASALCAGKSVALADAVPGGLWSSSNARATVSAGVVTGISGGVDTIYYTVNNTCGTAAATKVITINSLPNPGTIYGPSSVCMGAFINVTDGAIGGTWSSSNDLIANINWDGLVTPVAPGMINVIYTLTNGCGPAAATHVVTVIPLSNCTITIVRGVTINQAELKVYPNPNQGIFTMNLVSGIDEDVHVAITNIVGQKLKEFTSTTNKVIEITLDQPAGVYILSATTASGNYVTKVTVE